MTGRYTVSGMSCAACSARVERAVSALEGVESCSVNLLTGDMRVTGDVSTETVVRAVSDVGYGAVPSSSDAKAVSAEEKGAPDETRGIALRLIWSLVFLLPLMYFSMGHMLGAPLPAALTDRPISIALIQLLLSAAVMVINQKFFINGAKGVLHLAPNMDTLVSLGSLASFGYSVAVIFTMIFTDGGTGTHEQLHGLYFESAAMILALITVGKLLEAKAKGRTTDALRSLAMLKPRRATVLRDGKEVEVDIAELAVGDLFVVRAGDSLPTDGVVTSGTGSVDESMLTGESLPNDKAEGARVFGATVSRSGYMVCRATEVGESTALSGIIRMVREASSTKAPIAKLADKVSGVFVPLVMGIALVTLGVWLLTGADIGYAIGRAVSVLVISCPCALGLATPVAIMVGSGVGARRGILFKSAAALEEAGRVKTVVLDKTGTITTGEMTVSDVYATGDEAELLRTALSLEQRSEHPLGRAVVKYAAERGTEAAPVSDFETLAGRGVSGALDGERVWGVSFDYAKTLREPTEELVSAYEKYASLGRTPIVFIKGERYLGMLAVSDRPKESARDGIAALRDMGVEVVMLTGDNELSARAVADEVGIERVVAGVLPEGKEAVIRELCRSGKIAMVGDGINDAPSLTAAEVGIAVGCGTDIAIESADVVLMKDRLTDVAAALGLGRAALTNIRENLGWAFVYNCVGIPMAAGLFGLTLSPMFGALAMSLSSFSVVMNALRLNLWRPAWDKKQTKLSKIATKFADGTSAAAEQTDTESSDNTNEKENTSMVKMIKVEGMMCPHCEARVKKTLEAFECVIEAVPSHKDGTVTLTLTEDADLAPLAAAVEAQGYPVVE